MRVDRLTDISVTAATMSAITYIAANMRPSDMSEFVAMMPATANEVLATAAIAQHSRPFAYVVSPNGNPAFAFGVAIEPDRPHIGHAWGFGTRRARLAIPAAGEFIKQQLIPALIDHGLTRVEVRAMTDNRSSTDWLARYMGARFETTLLSYGNAGQSFSQFSWTREQFK